MSTKASAPPLVVRTGEGERSLAAGRAYLVGRDPQADIVVADPRVSWHHAELRAQNGRWALVDLGSTNGSYADGHRADLIEIDGTRQVRLGDPEHGRAAVLRLATGRTSRCSTTRAGQARRIGRVPDNDIVVPHLSVSRHHAELRTTPGGYRIVDLGSHNGTFVNEQRVRPRRAGRGRHRRLRRHHVPAGRRRAAPDRRARRRRRCRPRPTPWPKPGSGLPRGVRGGGQPFPRARGSPEGRGSSVAPRGQALSRPRSRTRCAGWCRGASGSRTSTS